MRNNGTLLSIIFIFYFEQCSTTYCTLPSGNLLVYQLTKNQEGLFECRAQNQYGMASTSAYLSVIEPLLISLQPQNIVVDVNSTVIVPCKAAVSSFLDVNYAWYYEVSRFIIVLF